MGCGLWTVGRLRTLLCPNFYQNGFTSLASLILLLLVTGAKVQVKCSPTPHPQEVMDTFYERYDVMQQVDLVFVLDRSGSVNRSGWISVISFVKNTLDHFLIDRDNARVAIVTFNSSAVTELNDLEPGTATDKATKCTVYQRLGHLIRSVQPSGHTATYSALAEAHRILQNTRPNAKKAVLLITDSYSNVGEHPRKMTVRIQSLSWGRSWNSSRFGPQVEIYAFGVASASPEFMQSVASDLPNHFAHFPDFKTFDQFSRSIRRDIAEDMWTDTDMSNCGSHCSQQNSDSKCLCGLRTGQFSCACKPGFEENDLICRACQLGFYKDGYVPEPCRSCPPNSTTSVLGATNSSNCHPLPGHQRCPELPSIQNGCKFYVSGDKLEEVANTGVDCNDVRDGNSCHYECHAGYRLLNGTKVMKCNVWGQWEGEVPYCKIVDCDPVSEAWANMTSVTLTYANRTTTYGSVIFASCWPGLVPFGPTTWTCGENVRWNGQSNFQCKEVHCSPLAPVEFSEMVPPDCANTSKRLGYECQMVCLNNGFRQKGPSNFTCTFEEITFWKPQAGESGQTECLDIQAPFITCPLNISVVPTTWDSCTVVDYRSTEPKLSDNSGSARYHISGAPENDTFCEGHTPLTYEAFDKRNNKMPCIRTITVIAKTVEIIRCPENITMPMGWSHTVSWPSPVFIGGDGKELRFTCNPGNGTNFMFGVTNVVCFPNISHTAKCEFQIIIPVPSCDIPFSDRLPFSGKLKCDDSLWHKAQTCSVKCSEGYERIDGADYYFCDWNGTWNLNTAWPQCYRSRRSNQAHLFSEMVITLNRSVCFQKQAKIYDSFTKKLNSLLKDEHGPCRPLCECKIRSVDFKCVEIQSQSRPSDDSATSLSTEEESMGNFSLNVEIESTVIAHNQSSSVSKDDQTKIYEVLDEVHYNLSESVDNHQFHWQVDNIIISVISVGKFSFMFDGVDCASDELRHIDETSAACFICPVGYYYRNGSDYGNGSCVPCPLGFYKGHEGGSSCSPCEEKKNTTSEGARNSSECLEPCSPGYSSLTGYEPCKPCSIGTYQSEIRSTSCLSCPENQTTSETESTNIDNCYGFVSCSLNNMACEPHGACILKGGDLQCLCDAGFTGVECEVNINECEHSLCRNNGTCVDRIASYECHCSSSFTGQRCEIEVDECVSKPCKNGGSCFDGFISYSCACPQGFVGANCEIDTDECASTPCRFGSCKDGINSFTCSCYLGYTGRLCDKQIDYCFNVTCHNHGQCISSTAGSRCSCDKGYTGLSCESKIDACISSPCHARSTCVNEDDSFYCRCPPGYIGDTCAIEVSPDFDLVFSEPSLANYVKLKLKLDVLSWLQEVTICSWLRSYDLQHYGTIWSYAIEKNLFTTDNANVLTASDYGNLKFFVNGEMVATNISLNNGMWHHLCFVWNYEKGKWAVYINGTKKQSGTNLATGISIPANGILVLGQEQDTLGGGFNIQESFVGEMTQFYIVGETVSSDTIADMASTRSGRCRTDFLGSVVSWTDVLDNIQGNVTVRNTSWCLDVNECRFSSTNNCSRKTRCIDTLGSFECVECASLDCQDDRSQACARSLCRNGATCLPRADDYYYCQCKSGFTGQHCETTIVTLSCDSNPCLNGGTCSKDAEACLCIKPWTGRRCQVDSQVTCKAQPCFNDGTCVEDPEHGYRCHCPPVNMTQGPDCEFLSACASSPCQLNATCVVTDGVPGYVCDCLPGFSGRNCEIASPAVCPKNCQNGGTCFVEKGQFRCTCTKDYKGYYCEIQRDIGVTVYHVIVKLEEKYPLSKTFNETFIDQIHQIYNKPLENSRLQVKINSIREGSILVDFDLNHTYFLDESYPDPKEMEITLKKELKQGRLGIYKATLEDFKFEIKGETSLNAGVYAAVIIVIVVVAVVIAVVFIWYFRKYRSTRQLNKSSNPMRVSNPMYQGDFSGQSQPRSSIQNSVYCDPVELLPYATSEDSDKESDAGANSHLNKKKKKNWQLRQSIPLPPKPDETQASSLCGGRSLTEMNRSTPPPPYSAHGLGGDHPPLPPSRDQPQKPTPSSGLHNYVNETKLAADSCYFVPLSDEEAEHLIKHNKSVDSVPDNPAFELESTYLIPRQNREEPAKADNAETIEMTYLTPRVINETELANQTTTMTDSKELHNGPNPVYAIRSPSCDSTSPSSTSLPGKQP